MVLKRKNSQMSPNSWKYTQCSLNKPYLKGGTKTKKNVLWIYYYLTESEAIFLLFKEQKQKRVSVPSCDTQCTCPSSKGADHLFCRKLSHRREQWETFLQNLQM